MSTKRLLCIATGLAFVVTTSITAAPAFAGDEAPSDAVQALDQVPGLADAATPNTSTDLSTDSLGFTAPTTSGDEVSLERASAEPSNVRLGNDGQQVATDSSKDTDTVVQQLAGGGGRIVEVLNSSDAPDAFTYNLHVPDGSTIAKQDDGSLLIGSEQHDGDQVSMEVTGVVGAPWAVDAAGKPVAASYDVTPDGRITMHVEHNASTQYPVVADPTYTGGGFKATWSVFAPWAVTVYLNKARSADSEDAGSLVCIGIAFVPVVGVVIAAICGVHNVMLRAADRYGYCQKWIVNIVSRSFKLELYKGGFCS